MQATTVAAQSTGTKSPVPASGLRSIGAKAIMALTSAGLTVFVIGHMLGNLQLFLGSDALNSYAAKLKGMPELLWFARAGLLAIFLLHIGLAIWLSAGNREARPIPYVFRATRKASLASRTMLWSGILILAFVIFHLAHFTLGLVSPETAEIKDPLGRHDVYAMVIAGFKVWWVAAAYILSMVLLGFHLSHGIGSLFQSLGINHPRYTPLIQRGGLAVAVLLTVGNISMPLAVFLGLVR